MKKFTFGPKPEFGALMRWAFGPRPARMPLNEFFDTAITRRHFQNTTDSRLVWFVDDLRQVAADGRIRFWGRDQFLTDDVTSRQPLVPIDAAHWHRFEVAWLDMRMWVDVPADKNNLPVLHAERFEVENLHTRTRSVRFTSGARGAGMPSWGYADIHIERSRGMAWLRGRRPQSMIEEISENDVQEMKQ